MNEFSLKLSRPRLCFECHQFGHGQSAGINAATTMGRQCTIVTRRFTAAIAQQAAHSTGERGFCGGEHSVEYWGWGGQ